MLKIVDRTSPRINRTPIKEEPVAIEAPISKAEEYKNITAAILAKKRKPTVAKKISQPEPPPAKVEKSISEVAEEIKRKRKELSQKVMPLQVIPPKNTFTCTTKDGETLDVIPTSHAIDQFRWRYWITDSKFAMDSDNAVYSTMMKVFNSGKRIAYNGYLHRNRMRRDTISPMVWGTKKMCFLIDTTTKTIITCELNGGFRKFNGDNFKAKVMNGTFDHSKIK